MKVKMVRFKNGWAEGTVGSYRWQALVFDEGSEFGINGGRISKLAIWEEKNKKRQYIVNYDREWDITPKTVKAQQALEAVLKLFN